MFYIYSTMQLNISIFVGIIHVGGMMIVNTYGFIVSQHDLLDRIYMVGFLSIPFSWILCKDECIISYLVKKYENRHYILGSDSANVDDIVDLFPSKQCYNYGFYPINHGLRVYSLFLVNERTTLIGTRLFSPMILLYSLYTFDITYSTNYSRSFYPYFHIFLGLTLFSCMAASLFR